MKNGLIYLVFLTVSLWIQTSYADWEFVGGGYDQESGLYRDLDISLNGSVVTIGGVQSIVDTTFFQSPETEGVFVVWSGGGSCGNWGAIVHISNGELTLERLTGCGQWIHLDQHDVVYFGYTVDEDAPGGLSYTGLCGGHSARAAMLYAPTSVYRFGQSADRPYGLEAISEYFEHPEVRIVFQRQFESLKTHMDLDRIRYGNEMPFCNLLASGEASLSELISSFYAIGGQEPENRIEYQQNF